MEKKRSFHGQSLWESKLLKVMKITVLLMLISLMGVFASETYSQTTRLTVNASKMSLEDFLVNIENQSEFRFFYTGKIDVEQEVSGEFRNKKIFEILDEIKDEAGFQYEVLGRQIILSPNDAEGAIKSIQQQNSVSGKVTDKNNMPLPGVAVVVKGTTNGTITNAEGNYTISNIPENATLQFSFVGMKTQEIAVDNNTTLNVMLVEESVGIEEVVAVGYGTRKRESLTGAISNIVSKDIQTTSSTGLAQKLSGKVSGLNIRQNTGEPGNFDNAINIRGFGSPLYIIDGIERSAADFQKLNSESIESISVLKDASAAIYGLNAANGVIIVTTKIGEEGKPKFQLSSNVGISTPTDVPTMANAFQYYTLRNDANINIGLNPFISKEELAKWETGGPGYESTNWADETLKKNSVRQEYSLSAQGGNDKIKYYFDVNYIDDEGLLQSNDLFYNKLNFRSNLSSKLTDNLTARVNVSGYYDKKESPSTDFTTIWRGTVSCLPINSVYANNNPEYINRVQDGQSLNPVATSQSDLTGYSQNKNDIFQTSIDLSYKVPFIKGLELKGVTAIDKSYVMGKTLNKDYKMYDYDSEKDIYLSTNFNKPASISNAYFNTSSLTFQAQVIYNTTISEDHHLSGTLIFEKKKRLARYASILKYYDFYTNDQIDQAGEANSQSHGNEEEIRSMSYLGRLNYDYKGKYLIEFAARYDGSYRYAPDQRWGFFPVVSGGWRISEESFMKDKVNWLSNMKIRSSYGIVGQDAGEPFQYVEGYTTEGAGKYSFTNGVLTNGVASPALVNENLTWMESKIADIGLDLGFLNNKISFTVDAYQRNRTGLLAYRNVVLPNTYGGSFPQENLNSDCTKGIEFSIVHQNTVGELAYSVKGNFNYARTMNILIEESPFVSSFDKYTTGASDRWSDIVWTYNVLGQYQTEEEILNAPVQNGIYGNKYVLPGDFIYEDVNNDGVIDNKDLVPKFYDEQVPKMNYGLTINASWKGFDLNALFQGAAKFSVRYTHAYTTMFWEEGNLPAYFMDRWHKADPYDPQSEWVAGEWPSMRTAEFSGQLYAESPAWRKDASYLRFKNLELGYTFNQGILNKIGITKLRLYSNINNVYTWCNKYVKPFDPEKIAGSLSTGWIYPIQKTFNIGLNVEF